MDVNTVDPYEQKLYNMFKSFDVQSMDSLDKAALTELCTTLELKDRGAKLVSNLIDTKRNNRVTFREFKEGLLNLLGTDAEDDDDQDDANQMNVKSSAQNHSVRSSAVPFQSDYDDQNDEVNAIITINKNQNVNESKSREVSPKLVVGGKKYGRRSRPQSAAPFESSQSDSEEDYEFAKVPTLGSKVKTSQKVQRSASHSDMHGTSGRRIRSSTVTTSSAGMSSSSGTKLKRCASLPAQKRNIDVVIHAEAQNLKKQLESSIESLDFENLSNSLFHEWNNFEHNAITDDTKATNLSSQPSSHRNRTELEIIFTRVGLQSSVACKLADEVYAKLDLSADQSIAFNDFLSLMQSDLDVLRQQQQSAPIPSESIASIKYSDDEYSNNPINDGMIIDLHSHSDEPTDWPNETMPMDMIIDMWEMAQVKNASNLLYDLGFTEKEINLSKLLAVIDEELQNVQMDTELAPLLRASLALHKTEVNALQRSYRHAAHENRQLHVNVRELNRRSFMLAQEVDERHANLESSAREQLRQLEQRHSEIVRDLTAQLTTDREHWSTLNSKLEKRIKQLETDDSKHRADMLRLQSENSALEKEQLVLQTQITDLLEKNIKLNNEIADVHDRFSGEKDAIDADETLELMDKISKLQIENANLRDKNDELVTELEEMHIELNKVKSRKQLRFDSNHSGGEDNASSGGEGSNISSASATKRRGDSPSKAKLSGESPRFGKLRKCHNDNSEGESETSGDWLALNSELNQSATTMSQTTPTTSGFTQDFSSLSEQKDNEIKELQAHIVRLETELSALKSKEGIPAGEKPATIKDGSKNESEREKVQSQRIQELEGSLEQMQKEYEACEDYWQGKLNEERQLYEEEQRISDEKFTELLKKMAEYEEQFSSSTEKDGRLTPIEEKCQLEQQYAELEAETEEFRETARQIFEEKTQEIEQLQHKIKELEERLSNVAAISDHTALQLKTPDAESVASSPISYLWHQSTIQAPTRDYQNPNWNRTNAQVGGDDQSIGYNQSNQNTISPIQRPHTPSTMKNTNVENSNVPVDNNTEDDMSSVKSFGTHSVASTHSIHRSLPEIISTSPNLLREEIKRLKVIELQLSDEIKGLAHTRDGLVMELQQLQEAKPVLERAYARTPHPSLIQRIQQLEQKNRHLQFCLKQQQQYTESIMHQTWQQQRAEMNELRGTVDTQVVIINEQAQRLTNSDLLVKDLYVENSQLTATIQRLEQQRSRNNILLQHQGVPGFT